MTNTQGIVIKSAPVATVLRAYNMQNVRVPVLTKNPYTGKVDQNTTKDAAINSSGKNYIDTRILLSPIMTDLTFDSVSYTDYNTGRVVTTQEIHFACVLINTTQPKRIIKTEIQGVDGTVKEYIGKDDAQISISGIIVGANGSYPIAEVTQLKKALDAPVAIPVVNAQLNAIGVFNIVVESYDIPQEAGRYSQQGFTISAISDLPIELQIGR